MARKPFNPNRHGRKNSVRALKVYNKTVKAARKELEKDFPEMSYIDVKRFVGKNIYPKFKGATVSSLKVGDIVTETSKAVRKERRRRGKLSKKSKLDLFIEGLAKSGAMGEVLFKSEPVAYWNLVDYIIDREGVGLRYNWAFSSEEFNRSSDIINPNDTLKNRDRLRELTDIIREAGDDGSELGWFEVMVGHIPNASWEPKPENAFVLITTGEAPSWFEGVGASEEMKAEASEADKKKVEARKKVRAYRSKKYQKEKGARPKFKSKKKGQRRSSVYNEAIEAVNILFKDGIINEKTRDEMIKKVEKIDTRKKK